MICLLADENFIRDIVIGLVRRLPELDVLTVQEAGLEGRGDPEVLEWAARDNRVLLTHDKRTMPRFAYERVARGLAMPGVIEVPDWLPIGQAIDDILIIALCSSEEEWRDRVEHLPL